MIFRSFSAPRKVAIRENNEYYKDPYTLLLEDCINNNLSYNYFQESIGKLSLLTEVVYIDDEIIEDFGQANIHLSKGDRLTADHIKKLALNTMPDNFLKELSSEQQDEAKKLIDNIVNYINNTYLQPQTTYSMGDIENDEKLSKFMAEVQKITQNQNQSGGSTGTVSGGGSTGTVSGGGSTGTVSGGGSTGTSTVASGNATQSGNNDTNNVKDMYDKLQYKDMSWPREKLAKILKWAHQKAYEYNKKIHDKGDKAAWYQKALQFLTRIIEFCTRKLHNFVSNDKNQITWEYDKKNDDKNTANSSTTTTPPATPKQESSLMRYNRYKSIIREHFDMTDIPTVRHVMALNEEEQNTLLISLTNRLYQLIVNKIDSVDFGEIPSTQGNVRRLSRYKQMRECIEVLHKIFVQYKENPEPVQVIDNALSNLENYSELFMASYARDIQFGQMVYETTTLGVIEAIGFMIAVCIEYVKEPKKQGLQVTLRKAGVMKVKNHLLYENLIKFNDACKRGDLERAIRPLIRNNVKDFSLVTGALVAIHIVAALYVICAAIIPFLRQMSYFFYATRVRISTYFDAQADLLEMNAKELKSNSHINTEDDRNKVIARQLKIAELFHATADKIAIDSRGAEIEATKTMKAEDKKYKMDEINSNPASVDTGGPLF